MSFFIKRPGMLVLPPRQRCLLNELLNNKYIRRICGFQSSGFRTFGPKMFKEYVLTLKALFDHFPALEHNFTNSIFPVVTFNLGPDSVTFSHLDFHNNPLGWCGITNGGDFDPKKSAQLFMEQLKLVIEFPSGATTLIPSAVITHGNTPLAAGETRCAITQYAAGGLFRYVKYGFKTTEQLLAQPGGRDLKAMFDGAPGKRAREGLQLFSKVDELAADHKAAFNSK
ncbi:hypothetical protein B0H17DRAFT_692051 [Mycena rosella]|uniref:Uncharacterized protein n=1 Tax=Mycena rosella TaxID=1033263 RepID=A0AAD7DBE4_MYCRO|nr:hypothetical protein B0H17DRAFT_692051 [Mycena rosella]